MSTRLSRPWMILLAMLFLLGAAQAHAVALKASLERNPIHGGESVHLVLELDRAAGGLKPDLTPLGDDFQILQTSANTQIEFIQGLQSAITRWTIELAPKREGVLTIPAIAVGQFQSPELTLEVLAPRSGNQSDRRDIFLEAEISPDPAYVQAQMRYVVRLLRAVDVVDGTLTEPSATNAVLHRLGRDISYTTVRDGQSYRVLERRYALFPQASGELVISPIVFEGEIVDAGQAGTGLSRLFARGKRVRLRTPVVRAKAIAPPKDYAGALWLPAKSVELTEEWSKNPDSLRAGEPITRTLRLQAVGLSAEQLPEVGVTVTEDVKQYGDQPITRTSADADWVRGAREQRIALVPASEGRYTLPEIRIDWWDTERDAPRQAIIPAREIHVMPGTKTEMADGVIPDPVTTVEHPPVAMWQQSGPWQILCALLVLVWLITLAAWQRARRQMRRPGDEPGADPATAAAQPVSLRDACLAGDARGARAALLEWAQASWPQHPPTSLPGLANRLADAQLRAELASLDRALYAAHQERWQGEALWQRARHGLEARGQETPQQEDPLPVLYPR